MRQKADFLKQLQTVHGECEAANRRGTHLPATLYLTQLAAPSLKISAPKELRKIAIEMEAETPALCDVKIVHAD